MFTENGMESDLKKANGQAKSKVNADYLPVEHQDASNGLLPLADILLFFEELLYCGP